MNTKDLYPNHGTTNFHELVTDDKRGADEERDIYCTIANHLITTDTMIYIHTNSTFICI